MEEAAADTVDTEARADAWWEVTDWRRDTTAVGGDGRGVGVEVFGSLSSSVTVAR